MTKEAPESQPIVFVVDDDDLVRGALANLFRSVGLRVEAFGSTSEFLQSSPACARSDFRAGLYPLAAVRRLVAARLAGPTVVLFAQGAGGVGAQLWGRVGSSGARDSAHSIIEAPHRRVLALSFGPDFIPWRRSGDSWPRVWPGRRLFFLRKAPAAAWPLS